jgi:hypothetical protein
MVTLRTTMIKVKKILPSVQELYFLITGFRVAIETEMHPNKMNREDVSLYHLPPFPPTHSTQPTLDPIGPPI